MEEKAKAALISALETAWQKGVVDAASGRLGNDAKRQAAIESLAGLIIGFDLCLREHCQAVNKYGRKCTKDSGHMDMCRDEMLYHWENPSVP